MTKMTETRFSTKPNKLRTELITSRTNYDCWVKQTTLRQHCYSHRPLKERAASHIYPRCEPDKRPGGSLGPRRSQINARSKKKYKRAPKQKNARPKQNARPNKNQRSQEAVLQWQRTILTQSLHIMCKIMYKVCESLCSIRVCIGRGAFEVYLPGLFVI